MLLGLLASPNICSRRWIWEQYDHQVMLNTVVLPGSDAAVLRIGDEGRGIAVSSDCNGRYCYLDPYVGAQIAFAEAARNVSCAGGDPAAITDCLNFGNPEKPEVFWTFYESVRGLSDACKAFGVPVISGNVSFYNESLRLAHLPDADRRPRRPDGRRPRSTPPSASRTRATSSSLSASRSRSWAEASTSRSSTASCPAARPRSTSSSSATCRRPCATRSARGLVKSAHDCSEGGIAVALAESCLAGEIGADVHLDDDLAPAASLFGETQSRIVVTVAEADAEKFVEHLIERNVPYGVIGTVGGERLTICEQARPVARRSGRCVRADARALVARRAADRGAARGLGASSATPLATRGAT